jgi:hypothetical protein
MAEMDAGNIVTAQRILGDWSDSSQALSSELDAPLLVQDSLELNQIREKLQRPEEVGNARKKMKYESYNRSTGKKNVPK